MSSFYPGDSVEGMTEAELIDLACRDLALALGERRTPRARVAEVVRWPRSASDASEQAVIPRYAPGHAARIARLERALAEHLPGVSIAGSYVGGLSVDQVIGRGRAVARRLLSGAEDVR